MIRIRPWIESSRGAPFEADLLRAPMAMVTPMRMQTVRRNVAPKAIPMERRKFELDEVLRLQIVRADPELSPSLRAPKHPEQRSRNLLANRISTSKV